MARKGRVEIRRERCKGCYLCVRACPAGVLKPDSTANDDGIKPVIADLPENCVACGSCYRMCPDLCFTIYEAA